MEHYMEYLAVPLPEDIQKYKYFGDEKLLDEAIDKKIASGVPECLKKRLEMEKIIMRNWVEEYVHDEEEALKICMEQIRDFTREELHELRLSNAVEWAYVNGKVMYKECFINNLFATRKAYLDRCLIPGKKESELEEKKMLDDTVAYIKSHGGVKAKVHLSLSTRVDVPEARKGQKVVCQLPYAIEYAQVKNVKLLKLSHEDAFISPADYPARTVRFEAVPDRPFSVEFEFENHLEYKDPKPERVSTQQPHFDTEEVLPHIRFTPFIKMMAEEIVGNEKNPLIKARKIYDFITTKNIYSFMRGYTTLPDTIPEYFLAGQKGDCGVQALTFITLCRCVGVPARWQSGLYAMPGDVGMHDWAQFYVAPYGWMFCDPSFGGSAWRSGNKERWDFYFSNLDPYRLPAASEFMRTFYVPMKHFRHDPYDNQSVECEFADAPVEREYLSSEREATVELIEE